MGVAEKKGERVGYICGDFEPNGYWRVRDKVGSFVSAFWLR